MTSLKFNIVIDPLYGSFTLDSFLGQLIIQPEIQRLREVRLSNINSFLLPGSANISRFEHSLGTAFLAEKLSRALSLPKSDRLNFICAALLHDVAITPFGHLMEEAFRYAGVAFDHEKRLNQIFLGEAEVGNIDLQIFQGKTIGFRKVLAYKEFKDPAVTENEIFKIKKGETSLGKLINGSVDLDNIDNVCRMSYHLGIPFRKELPLEIINMFFFDDQCLCFDLKGIELLEEWLNLRSQLYNILMTNPVDFSAKSMLIEAIQIGLNGEGNHQPILNDLNWKLTDSELISILGEYKPTSSIIEKFRVGNLYDIIGLYWIDKNKFFNKIDHDLKYISTIRKSLAHELHCKTEDILIYVIKDKRTRRITNIDIKDRSFLERKMDKTIGKESNQLLFGITTGKKEIAVKKNENICKRFLENLTDNSFVTTCNPMQHIKSLLPKPSESQRKLF